MRGRDEVQAALSAFSVFSFIVKCARSRGKLLHYSLSFSSLDFLLYCTIEISGKEVICELLWSTNES